MAAEAVELWPIASRVARVVRIRWHTDRFEPIRPAINNVRDTGHRLDVVHHRRLAKRPFDCRKRRLDPRPSSLTFEAFNQSGFFAANVRSGAAMQEDVERELAAQDIFAEVAFGITLVDRSLKSIPRQRVFVTQI